MGCGWGFSRKRKDTEKKRRNRDEYGDRKVCGPDTPPPPTLYAWSRREARRQTSGNRDRGEVVKVVDGRIPSTSPARMVEELDRRLSVLPPGAVGRANLETERARWERERREIRDQRIEYHRRLFRTHQDLARQNHGIVVGLLEDARKDKREEVEV